MTERCQVALKLTAVMHAAAAEALDYVIRIDFYAPYVEAMDALQNHYEHCEQCAAWFRELTKERE